MDSDGATTQSPTSSDEAMDSDGGFNVEENDGNVFLAYHHPKYNPIPQTQNPTSSGEEATDDKLLFLCPQARRRNNVDLVVNADDDTFGLNSSPEYALSTTSTKQDKQSLYLRFDDHPVLPLMPYNSKKFYVDSGCALCHGSNFEPSSYFCETHRDTYHKECVESPLKIKHPYHHEHSLQLYFHYYSDSNTVCLCCAKRTRYLVYHCTICQVFMHPVCAMKPIPLLIDPPKRHDHSLLFFPRQTSLVCNICGLLRKLFPTYICARCNFVAHLDCMRSPSIIKISRHHHRISYVPFLPSGEWSCGVCRKNIDSAYGAYACEKCSDYAVHTRCALRKDVCDREELEGVAEEADITQDSPPFDIISEGVILHFLHYHYLWLGVCLIYDEDMLCEACVLPIFEGNFYFCWDCNFMLHETCANARRRIQHALHPHTLTLKADIGGYDLMNSGFKCSTCYRRCDGFVYQCPRKECDFSLDVRCASILEPFEYQGHEHPLFLSLDPEEKPTCQVCKSECEKQLNCIKCDFIVCFKCVTLPYKARYKHDKHLLTILWGAEVCEKDWCEACELNLGDTCTEFFYWCNDCCTTLHIECLFGKDPYLKPGHNFNVHGRRFQILRKSNLSRPVCDICKNPCQGKIFTRDNRIACSRSCAINIV